jgi:response regulator of citrate/malate metabolism
MCAARHRSKCEERHARHQHVADYLLRSTKPFRFHRSVRNYRPLGEDVMSNARSTEPSLDELFQDASIQLLMRRDGVQERDVRALLQRMSAVRAAFPDSRAEVAIEIAAPLP